jgi:hypothetical protein
MDNKMTINKNLFKKIKALFSVEAPEEKNRNILNLLNLLKNNQR